MCQVLVPEHCLLGEPPKHEKFVSFHKSSVEWWPFVTYPQPKDRGHHSPKPQDASVQGYWHKGNPSTSLRHWHQLVTARSTFSVSGNGMWVASRLRPRQHQSAAFFFNLAGQEDEIPHLLWFLAKELSPNQKLRRPKSLLGSSMKLMSQSPRPAPGHPGLPNHWAVWIYGNI